MPIDGFMSEFIEGRSILMSLEPRNWLFMLSIRLSDMPRWWPIWLSIDMPIDGFMSEFIEGRSILMSLERRNWLWKCWVVAAEAPRRVARVAKTFMLMFEELVCVCS